MNDRREENRSGQGAPEQERVYAPTHAGPGTLNLRPFQKHGAPNADAAQPLEPEKEAETEASPAGLGSASAPEQSGASAEKADKPSFNVPDLFAQEDSEPKKKSRLKRTSQPSARKNSAHAA